MKKLHRWAPMLAFAAVAAVAAAALHHFAGLNFWLALAIVAAALLANGIVAEVEDESPGGFNNPRK